jgi:hypothetical protein
MMKNDEGTDFLPVRLVAVLIIASLVLVSAAACALEIAGELSKAAARDCASRIAAVAAAEYTESCPGKGDGVLMDVSVPDSVARLTFGPGQAGESSAYSLQYADGSCETYLPGVPVGSGSTAHGRGGQVVLCPGNYRIRVAVEDIDGRMMALLYVEAK